MLYANEEERRFRFIPFETKFTDDAARTRAAVRHEGRHEGHEVVEAAIRRGYYSADTFLRN